MPAIQWQRLARPLASRPAYDERSLVTALRDGIDPAGRRLHPAMPRYAVPDSLAADLMAALRQLERATAAGVTRDTIRIAAPASDNGDARSRIVRLVLERYVEALNAEGGTYGRAILLVDDPATAFAGVARPGGSAAALDLWPLVEAPSAFRLLPDPARAEDPAADRRDALAPGEHKWFMRAATADNHTALSGYMTFTATAPLAAPTQVGPSGTVATLLPTFEWTAVDGATSYDLYIYATPDRLLKAINTAATTQRCTFYLTAGQSYKWVVRARAGEEPGAWSPGLTITPQP